jgi:hypothetical protein
VTAARGAAAAFAPWLGWIVRTAGGAGRGLDRVAVDGLGGFLEHRRRSAAQESRRRRREARLVVPGEPFTVDGLCYPCGRPAAFEVGWKYATEGPHGPLPNWREYLFCPRCGLNSRMRAAVHLTELLARPGPDAEIYLTEQVTPLHTALAARFPRLVGSEFLDDDTAGGTVDDRGIRHEDVTALSFGDQSFDLVLTFDVLEHVPDYREAFGQCLRVLRPGGCLLFTVPFQASRPDNLQRARVRDDGTVEHLEPPEYHYDPIHAEGCLAFHHFGWELLDRLREAGFAAARAHFYWSFRFGYLGPDQLLFSARKP